MTNDPIFCSICSKVIEPDEAFNLEVLSGMSPEPVCANCTSSGDDTSGSCGLPE